MKLPKLSNIIIIVIILAFLIASFSLSPRAKVIPMIIAIPSLIIMLILIIGDIFPNLAQKVKGEKIDLFDLSKMEKRIAVQTKSEQQEEQEPVANSLEAISERNRGLIAVVSLGVLLFMIYFLGLLVGGSLFICLFYKFIAKERWWVSVSSAVIVGGVAYVLFVVALKTKLWEGLLFIHL